MTKTKRTRRLLMVASVLFVIAGFGAIRFKRDKATLAEEKNQLSPYHTVIFGANNHSLLAYELHYDGSYYGMYSEYSAVIRNMNPIKDDYKTCCKAVIRDIKRSNSGDIGVTIYDSYEAFCLNTTQHRFLSKSETAFVAKHTIANYNGDSDEDGECYCSLIFYGDAANGLYEKQSFVTN